MKITRPKEELDGIQWCWNDTDGIVMLDKEKKVHVTLRNSNFVEKISVISGYDTVEDTIGKVFFSKAYFDGGSAAYFIILKNGRIWFMNDSDIPQEQYEDVVRKIVMNPEIVKIFDKVKDVRAVADLVLS